ncbi:ubiE/COQ5 methyltransferase [Xylogone sp. PMI_703]|nr:ubiE/COQ5 methyltransferase [Xylogone sp. PMI_703]
MSSEQAVYTHGHHSSVVQSHAQRTAQNSAAFLLPYIKPNHTILDVGCGPGSITADFAALVPQGKVIGGDNVSDILEQASALADSRGLKNISFQTIDANKLPFPDNSFDIVFAHQVLQHVNDPVGILKEMRRVAKPGGVVAARDADYKGFVWYPELPQIEKWAELYQKICKANGAQPNAGRYLNAWALEAGFKPEEVQLTWSEWFYKGAEATTWGDMWTKRTLYSGFTESAKKHGMATDAELQEISDGWKEWGHKQGAFLICPSGEILCTVS